MAKAKQVEDDDVVMVGEPSEEGEVESVEEDDGKAKKKAKAEPEEDDEEETEDEGDKAERLGHGEDENEDKDARRLERQERKRRQREARDRDKTELRFLRDRNEALERRFSATLPRIVGVEVSALDTRISQIKGQISQADQVIANAITAGVGADAAEAGRIRDQLRDALGKVEAQKAATIQRAQHEHQQAQQAAHQSQQQPQVDPAIVNYAQEFIRKNPWYDPQRKDQDSKITGVIDEALTAEGYDPTEKEYWDELTRRIKRQLPHKFKKSAQVDDDEEEEEDEPVRRRPSGPRIATGGSARVLKKNEVYISPERKAAMIEAGAWDDPVLRKKYLKRYQEWDRDNKSRS